MLTILKQALRSLRLSPAFAVTVIVTLGVGIGLNAAIFTVVDNVLLRPLGYHDAERLVAVQTHFTRENRSIPRLGGPDYADLVRDVHGLESVAYYNAEPDGISVGGTSLYAAVASVSPRFAEVMGVQPVAGRLFNPAESNGRDVLVSEAFARNFMGAAQPASALGQAIHNEGQEYTVVGILPSGFDFPARTALWFEAPAQQDSSSRTSYNYRVVAKRRSDVTEAQLAAELSHFSSQLQLAHDDDRDKTMEAVSLQEQLTGRIRPTLNLLMGSVAVILLIVCANITHLQLVRATRLRRNVTIRTALGASRTWLARGAVVETVLLAFAGTAVALLLALPALRLLMHLAPPNTPRLAEIHLNLHVLLLSFLVAFAVMLTTALLPLWHSWHIDPASALRSDSSRGMESRASGRLRNSFIVAEVALTLTLSVAAVLLTRQLIAQSRQDLGFEPSALLTLDTHATAAPPSIMTDAAHSAGEVRRQQESNLARLDALLAATSAVPGVESAAAITGAPMGFGGSDASYAIRGRTDFGQQNIDLPGADMRPVTPGLFSTLGVPLLRGRTLSAADTAASPPVLVVNQEFVRQAFGQQDPIGQQIKAGYDFSVPVWQTIVGVVGDIRGDSPALSARPVVYMALAQHPRTATDVQIVVRTTLPPAAMTETLTRSLHRSHPEVAIAATTMQQNIADVQHGDRFRTTLFTLFAAVSILLAAIGMYGVTAYSVAQRRFEFGLRIALGATRPQLLTMVLRGAGTVAVAGIVLGTVLSLSLQKVLGSILGKLPAFDAAAYALAAFSVLSIALLATLIPARRAAGVDPMNVLRSE